MNKFDVIIIGGGPGGYTAAVRAKKYGLETALIEKDSIGGACINWGCVPTKALLSFAKLKIKETDIENATPLQFAAAHSKSLKIAKERKEKVEAVFEECKVSVFKGEAKLINANEVEIQPSGEKLKGAHIVIATGSKPKPIPGIEYDAESVISVQEAIQSPAVPTSAVILGSGPTGIEIATIWNCFGTDVTVLEAKPNIMGLDDNGISAAIVERLTDTGIKFITDMNINNITKTEAGAEVTFTDREGMKKLVVEKVLIAIGVVPNTENLGLEGLGIATTGGFIKTDDQMRTNVPNIFAVGDVTGKLALAFVASEQANIAIDTISGQELKAFSHLSIPRCIFSYAQVASVGLTETQARELGYDIVTINEAFDPYAKDVHPGEKRGIIKLIADRKSQKVYGVTMVGRDATDQIAATARLMSIGTTAPELIDIVCNRMEDIRYEE